MIVCDYHPWSIDPVEVKQTKLSRERESVCVWPGSGGKKDSEGSV